MPSPSLTIGGVSCRIFIADGITESWPADSGATADVTFKCAWSDRYTLARALKGYINPAAYAFVIVVPYQYPPSPNLFCTSIGEIRGIGPFTDSSGWLQYKWALLPAHFTLPTYQAFPSVDSASDDPSGLLYTTTKFKVSSEVFTPPGGAYFYVGGADAGKPVEESHVGFVRPRCEIEMVRHKFPFVPLDACMSIEGGIVNDDTVTFADHTFPRGTLLFTGMDSDPQPGSIEGILLWDLTFTFLGNATIEWNAFMDRAGKFNLINTKPDGSGDFPFNYISFNNLFGFSF